MGGSVRREAATRVKTDPDGGNGGWTRPLDFGGRVRPGSEPNIPLWVGPNPLQPPSKHQKKGFNPSGLDPTLQPNTRLESLHANT